MLVVVCACCSACADLCDSGPESRLLEYLECRKPSDGLNIFHRGDLTALPTWAWSAAPPILSVNLRHIRLIDLVSAKGKTKVSWLIAYRLTVSSDNVSIYWYNCNHSSIRNIKIEQSKQLYHNNTLSLFSPLPKLGHGCDITWPREFKHCLMRLWNDINQLTFVFPFAETRSIMRMWRQLTSSQC